MAYAFGEYLLKIRRRELWRGGELLALEPQVFDLLVYLVQNRERVVGKDDLLQAVWAGRIVSDSALTTRINAARRALSDSGEKQRLIRTFPRKGFRFVAEVEEASEGAHLSATLLGTPAVQPRASPPEKPSIAVLPFVSIAATPEQEHVADGTVEQIIAVLARIHWLSVIACGSAFACKGQSVDVRQVGRELGVRYLLKGSVRKSAGRLRLSAQLIDSETRAHLWADWCDGMLADVFELQDRIVGRVAASVEPIIETAEIRRSMLRSADDLSPHDLYLRALPGCYRYGARPLLQARDLLDHAIEGDPGLGPALAAAAGCRQFLAATGWADDPEANRLEAIELAQQGLQADGDNPNVLTEAARVLAYFTEDIDSAVAMIERALALNPSHARGWYWNGWIRLFAGQPDPAIEHFQTATRLHPHHRPHMTGIGAAHFFSRRYREAAEALVSASHELPGWPTTHRFLAAAYAQLGRKDKAQEIVRRRLQTIGPALAPDSVANAVFRNGEHSALYSEGLRAAAGAA